VDGHGAVLRRALGGGRAGAACGARLLASRSCVKTTPVYIPLLLKMYNGGMEQ
jgi:hypothetical protein